jgi:hypothetical protein
MLRGSGDSLDLAWDGEGWTRYSRRWPTPPAGNCCGIRLSWLTGRRGRSPCRGIHAPAGRRCRPTGPDHAREADRGCVARLLLPAQSPAHGRGPLPFLKWLSASTAGAGWGLKLMAGRGTTGSPGRRFRAYHRGWLGRRRWSRRDPRHRAFARQRCCGIVASRHLTFRLAGILPRLRASERALVFRSSATRSGSLLRIAARYVAPNAS